MKVYRLEQQDLYAPGGRCGIYRSGNGPSDSAPGYKLSRFNSVEYTNYHPNPRNDQKLRLHNSVSGLGLFGRLGDFHFGFESMLQLYDWFPREKLLTWEGHPSYLVIYLCPDTCVVLGDKQEMFRKSQAIEHAVIPIQQIPEGDL